MGKFKKSLPKVGRPASREHDHSAVTIRRAASLVLGFDVELFDRRPDRTGRGLSRYRRLWSKSSPDHGEDDRFRVRSLADAICAALAVPRLPDDTPLPVFPSHDLHPGDRAYVDAQRHRSDSHFSDRLNDILAGLFL